MSAQGPGFISRLVADFCSQYGVHQRFSPSSTTGALARSNAFFVRFADTSSPRFPAQSVQATHLLHSPRSAPFRARCVGPARLSVVDLAVSTFILVALLKQPFLLPPVASSLHNHSCKKSDQLSSFRLN